MPLDENIKRLVGERMQKTSESYSAARMNLARRFGRTDDRGPSARERARIELRKKFDQLHDAVDEALSAGLTWKEVADRLRLDPSHLERWLKDDPISG
jgi:transcriptional regulator GlxA family with amidase domain